MSAPIHPTLPAIERARQKKPLRSPDAIATPIARALDVSRTVLTSEPTDQSARTVTSRFATYRETIETLVSRARSRIDRTNQIVSRISRAGRDRIESWACRTFATRESRFRADPRAMDALAVTMCAFASAEADMTTCLCVRTRGTMARARHRRWRPVCVYGVLLRF